MKRACVIGWPIEHSRSPLIHGYWLRRYGIHGNYTKIAVAPGDVETFLRSLDRNGFAGCNVTVPHKEVAFRLADVKEPSAIAAGAANTLWLEAGQLHAANTDTYGFMANLAHRVPDWNKSGRAVSILGSGGAARAIVHGFLEAGITDVRVFNRTQARAEALSDFFGARVRAYAWDERNRRSRDVAVLVNTTTIGMKGAGTLDIDFAALDRDCVVSDIVYVPLETAFLKDARRSGLRTADGLGMLLHQAVPGFEKWFGTRPEVTEDLYAAIAADIGSQS
jgi:shikimate dehydrogenase